MKSCPTCHRTFEDTLTFCLIDGTVLSAPYDPQQTLVLPDTHSSHSLSDRAWQPTIIGSSPHSVEPYADDGRSEKLLIYVSAGGTCRDPMAKAITQKLLEQSGVDNPFRISARAIQIPVRAEASYAARHTIKRMFGEDLLAGHVPTQITGEEMARAHLILVMDRTLLKLLLPQVVQREKVYTLKKFYLDADEDVADPWPDGRDKTTLERYANCGGELREIIETNLERLKEALFV